MGYDFWGLGWDRVGSRVGGLFFGGRVSCVGAWGVTFGGWGVVLGLGTVVLGLREVVLGLSGVGFGGMILRVYGWDRVQQGGFAGWCVGFWGLVCCFGSWGIGFAGCGVVLGVGGSVLGSRGIVLGLGVMVLGDVVLGFGVGQIGSAGWWVMFWGSARCVGAWGIGNWG